MTDSEIKVLITAQADDLRAGISSAEAAVASGAEGMEGAMAGAAASTETSAATMRDALLSVNEAVETIETSVKALSEVAIVGVFMEAASGLREMIEATNEQETALLHLSERVSMSVPELAELQGVLGLAEVSSQSFTRAMTQLAARLTQAESGSTAAVAAFERIHLSVSELQGLSPEEVFLKVADALANLQDGMNKSGAAAALFGARVGGQLLPIFDQGSAKIQQLMHDFGELDPVTEQDAKSADQLHATWIELTTVASSLGRSISHDLRPALEEVESGFIKAMAAAKAWLDVTAAHGFFSFKPFSMDEVNKGFDEYKEIVAKGNDIRATVSGLSPAGQEDTAPVTIGKAKDPNATSSGEAEAAGFKSLDEIFADIEAKQRDIKTNYEDMYEAAIEASSGTLSTQQASYQEQIALIKQSAAEGIVTKQQEAAMLAQIDQEETNAREIAINAQIIALLKYPAAVKDVNAQLEKLQAEQQVVQTQGITKIIEAQTAAATETQKQWRDALDAIAQSFDTLISDLMSRKESAAQVFGGIGMNLANEVTGSLSKKAATTVGDAFGTSSMGASLDAAFKSAQSTISEVFSNAWRGMQSLVDSVFQTAFGTAGKVASTATQTAIGAGASGASSAATSTAETALATAMTTFDTEVVPLTAAMTALASAMVAATPAMADLATAEEIEAYTNIASGGALFMEHGGIVPSAMGGMITPGGNSAMWAILHPREMVLPADVTEKVLNGRSGGNGGSGDTHYHLNVESHLHAFDSKDVGDHIEEHTDAIAKSLHTAMRGGNPMLGKVLKKLR